MTAEQLPQHCSEGCSSGIPGPPAQAGGTLRAHCSRCDTARPHTRSVRRAEALRRAARRCATARCRLLEADTRTSTHARVYANSYGPGAEVPRGSLRNREAEGRSFLPPVLPAAQPGPCGQACPQALLSPPPASAFAPAPPGRRHLVAPRGRPALTVAELEQRGGVVKTAVAGEAVLHPAAAPPASPRPSRRPLRPRAEERRRRGPRRPAACLTQLPWQPIHSAADGAAAAPGLREGAAAGRGGAGRSPLPGAARPEPPRPGISAPPSEGGRRRRPRGESRAESGVLRPLLLGGSPQHGHLRVSPAERCPRGNGVGSSLGRCPEAIRRLKSAGRG